VALYIFNCLNILFLVSLHDILHHHNVSIYHNNQPPGFYLAVGWLIHNKKNPICYPWSLVLSIGYVHYNNRQAIFWSIIFTIIYILFLIHLSVYIYQWIDMFGKIDYYIYIVSQIMMDRFMRNERIYVPDSKRI